MKIVDSLTDEALLVEIGARLAAMRLARNLTQADLAEQAGLGLRTVQRLESGVGAAQLSGFLRVCRVLGILERLETLLPEDKPGPMDLLKRRGKPRKRARGGRGKSARVNEEWSWGDA